MAKVHTQLCIDENNYLWLLEEMRGRRQKNLSITINELLKNYQYMIRAAERAQKELDHKDKRIEQANDFTASYRKQAMLK